jgi:hypothetical protein
MWGNNAAFENLNHYMPNYHKFLHGRLANMQPASQNPFSG